MLGTSLHCSLVLLCGFPIVVGVLPRLSTSLHARVQSHAPRWYSTKGVPQRGGPRRRPPILRKLGGHRSTRPAHRERRLPGAEVSPTDLFDLTEDERPDIDHMSLDAHDIAMAGARVLDLAQQYGADDRSRR